MNQSRGGIKKKTVIMQSVEIHQVFDVERVKFLNEPGPKCYLADQFKTSPPPRPAPRHGKWSKCPRCALGMLGRGVVEGSYWNLLKH